MRFLYLYRVPGAELPFVFAELPTEKVSAPAKTVAAFRDQDDAHGFIDALAAGGVHVNILPSAQA